MHRSRHRAPLDMPALGSAYDELRADYNISRDSRYRRRRSGVTSVGNTGDYHWRSESQWLKGVETSRDFYRNDMVVGQGVRRLVDNVIQDGFTLDCNTGDSGLDDALEERWAAESCDAEAMDVAGELDWHTMEKLVLEQMIVDGDHIALGTRSGHLQLIEAHRCRSPRNTKRNVVMGVLLDDVRRRLEYWITKDDIDPSMSVAKVSDTIQYPTRDKNGDRQVFHVYRPDRVSLTRGVTFFAPIVDPVGMHDDLQFAKLVQAQLVSAWAIIHEQAPGELDDGAPPATGSSTTETLADGTQRTVEGISPGMEYFGKAGETIKGFSPNVPNAEFFQHASLILTFISINLDLPLAVFLLDPTKTNFSGWRGAVDQARLGFRKLQHVLAGRFHRPVYRFRVRHWMADDPAMLATSKKSGVDIFRHSWNPPRQPYIQPVEDASADLLRVRNALISPRRLHAEKGVKYYDIVEEIVEDNSHAITEAKKKAQEINKQFPEDAPVTWREVISLPTPDGVSVKLDTATPADKKAEQEQQQQQNERPNNAA